MLVPRPPHTLGTAAAAGAAAPTAIAPSGPGAGRIHPAPSWVEAGVLAGSQHGVISRRQLLELGFTARRIDHALLSGRLRLVHRGVYAVGSAPLFVRGRWAAAVLACGPRAVLGGPSAAALHDLRSARGGDPTVIVCQASPIRRPGIRVRRLAGLSGDEVTYRDGIRVTTVARTLLDLGGEVSALDLRKAVKQADILETFDLGPVLALLELHPRHPGAAALRRVLEAWEEPPTTRSPLEEAFPGFCARWDLPVPTMNTTVAGMEVDATFSGHVLAVEIDSWKFHGGRLGWEDDHERRAHLAAEGWTPFGLTRRQLRADGGRQAAGLLRAALARTVRR